MIQNFKMAEKDLVQSFGEASFNSPHHSNKVDLRIVS